MFRGPGGHNLSHPLVCLLGLLVTAAAICCHLLTSISHKLVPPLGKHLTVASSNDSPDNILVSNIS